MQPAGGRLLPPVFELVAGCCHQFKNWWQHLFLPFGQKCKTNPSSSVTKETALVYPDKGGFPFSCIIYGFVV